VAILAAAARKLGVAEELAAVYLRPRDPLRTLRGDGHYGRPEVMDLCDNRGIDVICGVPGNPVLNRAVNIAADDIRTRRAPAQAPLMRGYAEPPYQTMSPAKARHAVHGSKQRHPASISVSGDQSRHGLRRASTTLSVVQRARVRT
jgi:hypothetical protein